MIYRAEYQNEEFQIIIADNDKEAMDQAWSCEEENGPLWNAWLLDDDYNEVKCIF